MSALTMPDTPSAWMADAFAELVLAEDDLVRCEFEEIVAAEWGEAALLPPAAPVDCEARPWPPMPAVGEGAVRLGPGRRPPTPSSRERAPPCSADVR